MKDNLPSIEEPEQVYRVLEELPDEVSRRGKGEATRSWAAAQACRPHSGLPFQSFREWQEEQSK